MLEFQELQDYQQSRLQDDLTHHFQEQHLSLVHRVLQVSIQCPKVTPCTYLPNQY